VNVAKRKQVEAKIHPQLASLAMPVEQLVPDPTNARRHDDRNLQAIAQSLDEHGQRKPIVAQRVGDRLIVRAGNGTLAAAQQLGWSSLAVVVVEEGDVEATRYALRDNRTAELAEWDDDALRQALRECAESEAEIAALGWTPEEWSAATDEFSAAEVEPPELSSEERQPYRQITFIVHDDQHEVIERALSRAKREGLGASDLNENSNGNALAAICSAYA
jgi:ParB-like chromosome segregation protein Spo0J